MPKMSFESLEAIPEGLREGATQADGKFTVDVVLGSKLSEFRDSNIRLSQERDHLAGTLGKLKPVVGDDVDAFLATHGEMAGIVQQVKDGKLKGTDAIQAEVDNRVATMKTGYENQLTAAQQAKIAAEHRASEADQKWKRSIVDRAVTEAVVQEASGARPDALKDILQRAYGVFSVDEHGKLVAKDGDAVIYGADGVSPMSPTEWLVSLRGSASYFFKNSSGGGANGGGQGGQFGGLSKEDFTKLSPMAKLQLAHKSKQGAR